MFSAAVYFSSNLAWPPRTSSVVAWPLGHLGPSRVQQQSCFELVSSCHGATVRMCTEEYVFADDN